MIFLAVLVVATAAVAALRHTRTDHRTSARMGLGLALLVSGVTHFVNPTPFEQHLPPWVPAEDLLVAASGAAEIALGLALLLARPDKRLTGLATAGFLLAVFPANVYVAVAGVEVDGQPGGPYPWLRLPLQILFIAWAVWSTTEPTMPSPTAQPEPGATGFPPRDPVPRTQGPVSGCGLRSRC